MRSSHLRFAPPPTCPPAHQPLGQQTCGTTTLLRCLKPLLKATNELGLELEWLGYSRANYKFPDAQMFPHSSFQEEFGYLKKHPHLSAKLAGEGMRLVRVAAMQFGSVARSPTLPPPSPPHYRGC